MIPINVLLKKKLDFSNRDPRFLKSYLKNILTPNSIVSKDAPNSLNSHSFSVFLYEPRNI